MKDEIARHVARAPAGFGRAVMREYLQARMLQHIALAGYMTSLAFMGGTALRFLYAAPRYSEDLDFTLEREPDRFDFEDLLAVVARGFEREGYAVKLKGMDARTAVDKAFVKYPGLLHEMGLSPHVDETVGVKLEVDTNPPAGAVLEVSTVRRYVVARVMHHDKASLLAGKLAAVLMRQYTKGRDLYDLLWYLSDPAWPDPNLTLLQHAVEQTGWTGPRLTASQWPRAVRERLDAVEWERVRTEAEQFLERPQEADMLAAETFDELLSRRG